MQVDLRRFGLQTLALFLIFALALFLPGGNLLWPAGWIFLLLFFGYFLMLEFWLYKHNPGLMQERLRMGAREQKSWDKLLFPLLQLIPLIQLIISALDANRFHWLPLSTWLQMLGALILQVSFYIFFLTFRENSFLSTVVRIQEERGHKVVSTGPYHYVRHPMYLGIVLYTLGTALLLGSGLGLLLGLLLVLVLMFRAVLEERTLARELDGYAEYQTLVKYRLIPYIW